MFTPIIQFLQKNRIKKLLFLSICFFFLSAYPIYKNYINGEAVNTYQIYRGIIEGHSEFYNPWQYRILCPLLVEGAKQVYDHTIDKMLPIERLVRFSYHQTSTLTPETARFLQQIRNPEVFKYIIIFLIFRFIEDFVILLLSFYLLSFFIRNRWLVFLGLILISWSMGNGVNASALTFNTYLDDILYLLTGCIILYKKNLWYILPISIVGAANRETSLLIPYLLFVSCITLDFPLFSTANLKKIKWPSRKIFLISGLSLIAFVIVFTGLRMYFGYRPQTVWKVPAGLPMLKLNLFSAVAVKGYFEMFGAFSVFPLICLYKFRQCSSILKIWFIAIVPVWFFVHLYSVVVYESRLFFVPTFLIFIPMVLEIIEKAGGSGNKAGSKSSASTRRYMPE
jgi:hypothetical protein